MKYLVMLISVFLVGLVIWVALSRENYPLTPPPATTAQLVNQSLLVKKGIESFGPLTSAPVPDSKVGNRYVSSDDAKELGLTESQMDLLAKELDKLVPRIYDVLANAAHVDVLDDKTRKVTFDANPEVARSAKDEVGSRIRSVLPDLSDLAVERLVNSAALAANFEMFGGTSLTFHFDCSPISNAEAVLIKREYVDAYSGAPVQVATEGIAVIEGFRTRWGTLASKVMN